MKLRTLSVPLVAFAASILIACGSDTEATPTPSPTPTPDPIEAAVAALTIDDLEPFVLSQDAYGTLAAGMSVSESSGPVDNAAAAEDFSGLGKTGADLAALGRLGGYELGFETLDLEPGQIVELDSWIELFDEGADISSYLDLNIESLRESAILGEYELIDLVELDIPSVENSNAWSIVVRYEGLDEPVRLIVGTYQHGPLLAGVQIVEYGPSEDTATIISLLEQLDAHIEDTLTEAAPAS